MAPFPAPSQPLYAPLLNHTVFSLLDSTIPVNSLVEAAAACRLPAAAITDTATLAGAVQFYQAARAAGIHPVIGAEIRLDSGERLALLVENETGYRNLCRLLTAAAGRPCPFDLLAGHAAGLVCLYGPWNPPAQDRILRCYDVFAKNFALVLAPHNADDLRRSRGLVQAGRRLRIPVVAAAAAHYLVPEDRPLYDVVASMRTLTLLRQAHPEKLGPGDYHFHTPQEMQQHFAEIPQALRNSLRIAERCRYDFPLGDILFPEFPSGSETPQAMLRRLASEGLRRRYGPAPRADAVQRLNRELSVIEDVGYAGYFLIFADIVHWANRRGIDTLARGSAAGSLVCYALGISNVCPFRFGLCFERFLNKERMQFAKLADIDLDLPWDRRDEVVRYVFDRYGAGHVAMIGAVNTFQGRSAVADVAKVFGIPEREVRRFTEHLPHFRGDASGLIALTPECAHLPYQQEPYRTAIQLAARLDGFPRHFQMHPCGLVISGEPITNRSPLFLSDKGLMTTHYAMDDIEELGLLKMDLLGQAGLSVLRDAIANVRANRGQPIDLHRIGETDAATWNTIATGNARGVFHIESPAMTSLLVMSDCRDLDCLTAVESIIRPGAANEGRKRAFARRHQGLEPVTYPHPSLAPLLADTYGLMAYEEHILLVANGFAGMPWGRADILRRALVKNNDRRKIDQLGREFHALALQRGHTAEEISAVWKTLEDFAGYMFNKAHSAAYAVEAYRGAWLKTYYPVEFLAAVLSSRRGFYAPIVYVLEALRHGAVFLPPDVNLSGERFLVDGNTIRLPLEQIQGFREETAARIRSLRPFRDAGDFFRRVQPRHAEWLALLKVGAFASLGETRSRLFWRLARLQAAAGTPSLVDAPDPGLGQEDSRMPVLRWEQELLGFPVSRHPLDYFAAGVRWERYVPAVELTQHLEREVEVCGLVVCDRLHPTERGIMKFLTLADYSGFMEVALFPEVYRAFGHRTTQPVLAVRAVVDPFDNRKGAVLNALRVMPPARRAA